MTRKTQETKFAIQTALKLCQDFGKRDALAAPEPLVARAPCSTITVTSSYTYSKISGTTSQGTS
jgi:hypothetical protein